MCPWASRLTFLFLRAHIAIKKMIIQCTPQGFLSGQMRCCKFSRCSARTLTRSQDSGKIRFALRVNSSVVAVVIDDVIATITTSTISIGSILLPPALYQMPVSGRRGQSLLTNRQGPPE